MKTLLLKVWDHLRSSFWFVPAAWPAWPLALALCTVVLDKAVGDEWLEYLSWSHSGSAESASLRLVFIRKTANKANYRSHPLPADGDRRGGRLWLIWHDAKRLTHGLQVETRTKTIVNGARANWPMKCALTAFLLRALSNRRQGR